MTSQQPIVFIHGSGDSARVWDEVIARLPEYQSVALDLPGHGALADAPLADVSVSSYAEWVRSELARIGVQRMTVVGHSLGGAIALRLALDAPQVVGRLGLVGAGARLRVAPAFLAAAEAAEENGPGATPEIVRVSFAESHGSLADAYSLTRQPTAPGALFRDLSACDVFNVMAELDAISQPTLIVVGAEDRMTPVKYATYLHDHISGSELVIVPGSGHYVQIEYPQRTADALRAWLS